MSIAFVILAAGKGSRMGRVGAELHKALLPLHQQAILTHLIELAPRDAEIIICAGYRAQQLRDYTDLAHPGLKITWVPVSNWDQPGAGPGASLLKAKFVIGDRDLIVTSCDTLWEYDTALWTGRESWAAYASIPPGTRSDRWCRLVLDDGKVTDIIDKSPRECAGAVAYTGLARIARDDLPVFWDGLTASALVSGERQVPGGLAALAVSGKLHGRRIAWTDTGDESAYRQAIIARDGYDWSKEREATWVLPKYDRVVKWWADPGAVKSAEVRQYWLDEPPRIEGNGFPAIAKVQGQMMALEYITGVSGYDVFDAMGPDAGLKSLMESRAVQRVITSVVVSPSQTREMCDKFYRVKTHSRVAMLPSHIRSLALSVLQRVDWDLVTRNCQPVRWHGDFNLGNTLHDGDSWHLIDWRSTFTGDDAQPWGDWRHDVAKFTAGLRVRWDWARRGDFRPWPDGMHLARTAVKTMGGGPGTEEIGILTLLASAPLHASPLDEVLVARAAAWMSELR